MTPSIESKTKEYSERSKPTKKIQLPFVTLLVNQNDFKTETNEPSNPRWLSGGLQIKKRSVSTLKNQDPSALHKEQ
jgi:ribosomal protein L11